MRHKRPARPVQRIRAAEHKRPRTPLPRLAPSLIFISGNVVNAKLKANADELIRRGGLGSPTLFVNGGDMYFGNDRLPLVRAALLRGAAAN